MKRVLIVVTAGCILATVWLLACLVRSPKTGWMARSQLAAELALSPPFVTHFKDMGMKDTPDFGDSAGERFRLAAAAARHPQDYQIQLAHALDRWSTADYLAGKPAVGYIRAIKPQFSSVPDYYAAELRFAAMGELTGCHRAE